MRTGGALFHSSTKYIVSSQMTTISEATTTTKATFSPPATIQRSPWHSPVPYLFGGLAAMLGLIAFALLILACSYWKLSGEENERDVESGTDGKGDNNSNAKGFPVFEEKFLVIMAGDVKPTFLATPMLSSKTNSFNDEKVACKGNDKEVEMKGKVCDHEETSSNQGIGNEEEGDQSESHLSQEQNSHGEN